VVSRLDAEKPLAVQAFKDIARRYSYHESGGAPLLGVDGICMICHGSSNAKTITNALRSAVAFRERRINPQIVEQLAECGA
jgi:glycerol-3-phosphate acyltransferase PlsX